MHIEIHACACFHFADLKTLWLHEQLLHELLVNRVWVSTGLRILNCTPAHVPESSWKKDTSLWMCISFLFYFLAEGCAQSWHFCARLCFQKLKFSTVVLLFYARCTRAKPFEKIHRRRTRTRTRAFFYHGRSVIQRQSAKQLPQKWGDSGLTCFFPCLGRPRRLSTSFSSLIRKDTNWFCTPISSTISS